VIMRLKRLKVDVILITLRQAIAREMSSADSR